MNDRAIVDDICRPRARSKNARIVGNRIVGVGEPELIALDAVVEESDFVRLEIRIKRKIFDGIRQIAKAQGRSVSATLERYLNRTIIFLGKKLAETGVVK